MKNINKKELIQRILICILGNVLIGVSVAITKQAAFGNDPFNGMNLAVSAVLGIPYVYYTWIFNLAMFVIEFIFGRKYIFIGTFINWFMVAAVASAVMSPIESMAAGLAGSMPGRIVLLAVGLVICSLGLAVYQRADLGISPFDVVPFLICDRFPKLKFMWPRLALDGSAVLLILLCGGIVGIGTAAAAFLTGPLVQLYYAIWDKFFPPKKAEA
ncbi:MAG: hypothetical protein IKZ21_06680 [Clostridia bacterium]|nr:hypothetical protein [Clostridia bacterium]